MAIEDDIPAPVPDWILTYGDMMSLLLTFFIMLVSMSEMKSPEKFHAMADSMRQQFGLDVASTNFVPGWAKPRDPRLVKTMTTGRSRKQDTAEGNEQVVSSAQDPSTLHAILHGGNPSMAATIYFAELSAVLSEENMQDLQVIALGISGKSHKIEIRGHSIAPSKNDLAAFDDCWDLAYLRALNAMRFLIEELKIDPRRMRVSVAGPNEPVHIGSDPIKLRQNDRIEIYLLEEIVVDNSRTTVKRKLQFTNSESL